MGKVSRSESKSEEGDKPEEDKMQSKTAGTAAWGTWLKLVDSELIRAAIEPVSLVDISFRKIAPLSLSLCEK